MHFAIIGGFHNIDIAEFLWTTLDAQNQAMSEMFLLYTLQKKNQSLI